MKKALLAFLLASALAAIVAALMSYRPRPENVAEEGFVDEGKILVFISYNLPDHAVARSIIFDTKILKEYGLYLKNRGRGDDYVYADSHGRVTHSGKLFATMAKEGRLLIASEFAILYVDGVPLPVNMKGWSLYWATRRELAPPVRNELHPSVTLADSFMRHKIEDENCRVTSGTWKLAQHGAGMPRDQQEMCNGTFARTVNPFTVRGSENGFMTYGNDTWLNYRAEALFYFGVPKTGKVIDINTLPTATDMMIVHGRLDGEQVAFGWKGESQAFVLMTRSGERNWTIRERWTGKRPPLTNWVKLGLAVRRGYLAEAYLDGVPIINAQLETMISGPFHIHCGRGPMEVDDVCARSFPKRKEKGSPFYVKSRNFGEKELTGNDPLQFSQWSRSSAAFKTTRTKTADGGHAASITTFVPLMGDFLYESVPFSPEAVPISEGTYEFSLIRACDPLFSPAEAPIFAFRMVRGPVGWTSGDLARAGWQRSYTEFALRFARRSADGNRISIETGGRWLPISAPVLGPVYFSVSKVHADNPSQTFPDPNHHTIYCVNLVNELFEKAPCDWRWVEGAFRMDSRWACADRWNFMACGSAGVPFMSSKKAFYGDQLHEYYMSLRPVFPWDIGDSDFVYDPTKDKGWAIFTAHEGWYNRRDLNFSFCFDGLNPLSGYAVIFGGDDNTETRLLRKGVVVARTTQLRFLFPTEKPHGVIHWNWWKFHVRRIGNRVRVYLNDDQLFDYTDAEPLRGGHIAFWSIRNGFTIARVTSMAEELRNKPHLLYVGGNGDGIWRPLVRDTVQISSQAGDAHTRVEASTGAGFHAVRFTPPKAVNVQQTPIMKLSVTMDDTVALNLHLMIGNRSYIIQVSAPLAGMKSLLTPQYEKGECFRIPTLSEAEVKSSRLLGSVRPENGVIHVDLENQLTRLQVSVEGLSLSSVTVGNTSNPGYLLAGNGKNEAGTSFALGTPRFLKR